MYFITCWINLLLMSTRCFSTFDTLNENGLLNDHKESIEDITQVENSVKTVNQKMKHNGTNKMDKSLKISYAHKLNIFPKSYKESSANRAKDKIDIKKESLKKKHKIIKNKKVLIKLGKITSTYQNTTADSFFSTAINLNPRSQFHGISTYNHLIPRFLNKSKSISWKVVENLSQNNKTLLSKIYKNKNITLISNHNKLKVLQKNSITKLKKRKKSFKKRRSKKTNQNEVSKRDQSLYPQPKVEVFPVSSSSDTMLRLAEDPVNPSKLIAIKPVQPDVNFNMYPIVDTADSIVRIKPKNDDVLSSPMDDIKEKFSNDAISSKRDESISREKNNHSPFSKLYASDVDLIESRDIKKGIHYFPKHIFDSKGQDEVGYTKEQDEVGNSEGRDEVGYTKRGKNAAEDNHHKKNDDEKKDEEDDYKFNENPKEYAHKTDTNKNNENHHDNRDSKLKADDQDDEVNHDKPPYKVQPYVTNEEFKPRFDDISSEDRDETPNRLNPSENNFHHEINRMKNENNSPHINNDDNFDFENREKLPSPFEERRMNNNEHSSTFHEQKIPEPYRHIELRTTNDGKNEYASKNFDEPNKDYTEFPEAKDPQNFDYHSKDPREFDNHYNDKHSPEENERFAGERVGDVVVESNPSPQFEPAPYSNFPEKIDNLNNDNIFKGRENENIYGRGGYGRRDNNNNYKENDDKKDDDDNNNDDDDDDDDDDNDDNDDDDDDDDDDNDKKDEKKNKKLISKEDSDPAEDEDVNWDDIAWLGEYGHAKYSESGKFSKPRMYTCMLEKMKSMQSNPMCATSKRHGLEKRRKSLNGRSTHRRRHHKKKNHHFRKKNSSEYITQAEQIYDKNIQNEKYEEKENSSQFVMQPIFALQAPFVMQPLLKKHNKNLLNNQQQTGVETTKRQLINFGNFKNKIWFKNNPKSIIERVEDSHDNLNFVHRVYHGEDHGDFGLTHSSNNYKNMKPMMKWSKFPPFSKMKISVHFRHKFRKHANHKKYKNQMKNRLNKINSFKSLNMKYPPAFAKNTPKDSESYQGAFPKDAPNDSYETLTKSSNERSTNSYPGAFPKVISKEFSENIPKDNHGTFPADTSNDCQEKNDEDSLEHLSNKVPKSFPENYEQDSPQHFPKDYPLILTKNGCKESHKDFSKDSSEHINKDVLKESAERFSEDIPNSLPNDQSLSVSYNKHNSKDSQRQDFSKGSSEHINKDVLKESAERFSEDIPNSLPNDHSLPINYNKHNSKDSQRQFTEDNPDYFSKDFSQEFSQQFQHSYPSNSDKNNMEKFSKEYSKPFIKDMDRDLLDGLNKETDPYQKCKELKNQRTQRKALTSSRRITFNPMNSTDMADKIKIDINEKPNVEPVEINGNIVLAIPHIVQQVENWKISDMNKVSLLPEEEIC
ncbi:protein PF3D7_1417600 isoform X1 [Hydra vulgaris]|uniref:protein PF3D7_1417600 isoform X1 n=1 Tax=Hydra vulgaris TaxID=6087 RepID=UPI001F5F38E6|nr:protein PF3D7_1417600 [Hydra vulgaris]